MALGRASGSHGARPWQTPGIPRDQLPASASPEPSPQPGPGFTRIAPFRPGRQARPCREKSRLLSGMIVPGEEVDTLRPDPGRWIGSRERSRPRPCLSSRHHRAREDARPIATCQTGEEVISLIDWTTRRAEAWALLRKGGLSAKIARTFLTQHGTV